MSGSEFDAYWKRAVEIASGKPWLVWATGLFVVGTGLLATYLNWNSSSIGSELLADQSAWDRSASGFDSMFIGGWHLAIWVTQLVPGLVLASALWLGKGYRPLLSAVACGFLGAFLGYFALGTATRQTHPDGFLMFVSLVMVVPGVLMFLSACTARAWVTFHPPRTA